MRAAGLVLCAMVATVALGQNADIYQRLKQDLTAPGDATAAAEALAKKDFAQVEEIIARTKTPDASAQAELLSLRGAVEFLDKKMDAAAKDFSEAEKLHPPLKDTDQFTFAMALVELGDDARARTILTSLAEEHPKSALYVYWLGRIDYGQRRYDEAIQKLGKATELDPQSARAWDSLGLAFDMQGSQEQALQAFDKAVSLNRTQTHPSPWPPHDMGYLLLRMERSADAEAALRESLRYDANLAQTHYYMGRVLEKEGRSEEAVKEYESATELDRTSPEACYSLGMLYRKLHRDADAEAMFAEWKKRKQATP